MPKIKYSYFVLLLFIIIESFLFASDSILATAFTVVEYLFVFIAFLINKEVGIQYFISFTLLSFGIGNYTDLVIIPANFWGIRVGTFSFNILFSLVLFFLLIKDQLGKVLQIRNLYLIFLISFVFYSFIIGTLFLIIGRNYQDNYISDVFTYLPIIIYLPMLTKISKQASIRILKDVISISIIGLIFCFILDKRFLYGDTMFLATNTLYYILPFFLFSFISHYGKRLAFIYLIIIVSFIVMGDYFVSGKFIISIFLFVFWFSKRNFKTFFSLFIPVLIFLTSFSLFLNLFADYFSGSAIAFKFLQIAQISEVININDIASGFSSLGNLIAEGMTTFTYLVKNPIFFLFGQGFGGTVPDVYGYLAQFAGNSGYSALDLSRNAYFKMHLPIYEMLIKGGVFFLFFYFYLLYKSFKDLRYIFFSLFLLFFLYFYISKEFILLTLLLLKFLGEFDKKSINTK